MQKKKKLVVLFLSSILLVSNFMSNVNAETMTKTTIIETIAPTIQANNMTSITNISSNNQDAREELVSKLRELFPNKFDFIHDEDFELETLFDEGGYRISFYKRFSEDKSIYGNFQFDESEQLISYYYDAEDSGLNQGALFPPKVEREEAKEIAREFLNSIQLMNVELKNDPYQFRRTSPLTEPIEYHFSIIVKKNGVQIQDQQGSITVQSNGEITRYYNRNSTGSDSDTFEDINNILSLETIKEQVKNMINLELVYLIDWDYRNDEIQTHLAYSLNPNFDKIYAQDGSYILNGELTNDLKLNRNYKFISDSSSQNTNFSKEEAEKLAIELLAPADEAVDLVIKSVNEGERSGLSTYEVNYMYNFGNSGTGSSVSFDKETGDVLSFHKIDYRNQSSSTEQNVVITVDEASGKAIEYLKKYAPAKTHELVYYEDGINLNQTYLRYGEGTEYVFHFPQYKEGIRVEGNGADVSVSKKDGTLMRINVNDYQPIQWPNPGDAISQEKVISDFINNLTLELIYDVSPDYKLGGEKKYLPYYSISFAPEVYSFYDAIQGKWLPRSYASDQLSTDVEVEYSWAKKEIDHLIMKGIISVDENETVDPGKSITVGDGLNILIKSINDPYDIEGAERVPPTFSNINSEHGDFHIIERAVFQEIINVEAGTFVTDETLTREKLAYWYVRVLGLQKMAEQKDLYLIDFADRGQITNEYQGHVAIANALGLLTENQNRQFRPQESVSMAEVSVSVIRLANMMGDFE
ncbi:YcdB/YcdC domain-containing protein [Chengkuizengella sp. SCS-71B]|uniref:YcdB/YcdC domain-containing protein n=1 Tax=Chengkuizengella sp. SCS-71B TaxID=3115290 RepID=UPI0032C23910